MAVIFDGDLIDDADATTGWSAGAQDTDSEIQGAACMGAKASNATVDFVYTIQGGDPIASFDFSAAGADFGKHIFVWLNCLTPNLDLKSGGGLGIIVGDGTNQGIWFVGGDGSEADDPYKGGWFNFIIDPSRDFDAILAGTWTVSGNPAQLTAVTEFGGRVKTIATIMGNFNNALCDVIRVGKGLILTGGDETDPHDMAVLLAADEGTKDNRYGVLGSRSGVLFAKGTIQIGDGTELTYFEDSDQTIVWEDVPVAVDFHKWIQEDNGNVRWGNIQGSGASRIGSGGAALSSAASTAPLTFDIAAGTFTEFDRAEYAGCIIKTNGGAVLLGEKGQMIGCLFDGCGEIAENGIDIVGGTIQNSVAASNEGALLMDSNGANLSGITFNSNDRAVRLSVQGNRTFTSFDFNSNAFDILNDSGDELTVTVASGGNVSTIDNATTDSETLIANPITLTLTGIKDNSEVRIYDTGTQDERDGIETVSNPPGTFTFAYNFTPADFVDIVVMNVEGADGKFQWFKLANFELAASDASLPINQLIDRNYENPS